MTEARIYVGIDWASEEHEVCVIDAGGERLAGFSVKHSGDGLAELVERLMKLAPTGPGDCHVAIEVPHGAVVETLLERSFVVHAINPKQLDRFRDRFSVAGAKDDRLDAYVLADSLRTDTRCFRALEVEDPRVISLREWSRIADDLRQEHVRLTNRMRQQLVRYYPQALGVTKSVGRPWFLDLWEHVSTPARARRVKTGSVDRILKAHRIRRINADGVLEILRQTPVSVAPGTVDAATAHIRLVVARLRVLNEQVAECHRRLDELIDDLCSDQASDSGDGGDRCEQHDATILRSLPGVGRIVLATLLAEAGRPLRARDYQTLRALAGVAPVTHASGKRRSVVMRNACHQRLRSALYHWTRVAAQRDPVSRAAYVSLRQRGKTHGRALRTIGDRLLAVACAMLRNGTTYDPTLRKAAA